MKRDFDVAEHHRRIAERDKQIYDTFASPEQVTMSKHEMHKTAHINSLSDVLLNREQNRTTNYANIQKNKKDMMLADTIQQNELIKQMKASSLERTQALKKAE